MARFAREAKIGSRLGRSVGYVRATDWGELPGGDQLYLAMDLVDGRTLKGSVTLHPERQTVELEFEFDRNPDVLHDQA